MFSFCVLKQLSFRMPYLWTILLVFVNSCLLFADAQTIFEEAFIVKPGGQVHTVERKIVNLVCTFTYAAQGGTDEEWVVSLKETKDDRQFTCAIYRPGGMSYLFFLQFKLAVTGAKVQEVELYGERGGTLGQEEYILDKKENQVTHAEGMFKSQLSRILIVSKYKKHKDGRKHKLEIKQKKEL